MTPPRRHVPCCRLADLSTAGRYQIGALLGTLLCLVVGTPFFWPSGRPSGDVVWHSFVHRRFAEELDRWYGGI